MQITDFLFSVSFTKAPTDHGLVPPNQLNTESRIFFFFFSKVQKRLKTHFSYSKLILECIHEWTWNPDLIQVNMGTRGKLDHLPKTFYYKKITPIIYLFS